jgi:release factor glutamine methyltransferase
MKKVAEALVALRKAAQPYSDTPAADAQVLLAHLLDQPRSWVIAHGEALLDVEQSQRFEFHLGQVQAGTPLPYVIGTWSFFGRSFRVTPDVLIPRPETELLIETALGWLDADRQRLEVVDVGTGSGIIACTLAAERPALRVQATDISLQALEVARHNAGKLAVEIKFTLSDLLSNVQGPFDLIAANLPYIPTEPLKQLPIYGREPLIALDGGPDGLVLIRRLLAHAPRVLQPGGAILLEIEAEAGVRTTAVAREIFPNATIDVLRDLADQERLVRVLT